MLIYEKKIYHIDFNVMEESNVVANGKLVVTVENDYNFNELNAIYEVEYFLNDQTPDVSKEDIEAYFDNEGIDDLESSEIEISKDKLLEFLKE